MAASLALAMLLVWPVALSFRAGIGPATGALVSFAMAAVIAGRALRRSYPYPRLGGANVITLGRLALASALVAPLLAGIGPSWSLFSLALVALLLDGADGWLARRQGLVSAFGARFDMEVDAALALVLALSAAMAGDAGLLAVLLGVPRYLFAAAAWRWPWMQRELPERFSRKVVCVLQLGVLITLQVPLLPGDVALVLVPVMAAALAWSFAVDVRWLRRQRA